MCSLILSGNEENFSRNSIVNMTEYFSPYLIHNGLVMQGFLEDAGCFSLPLSVRSLKLTCVSLTWSGLNSPVYSQRT